MGFKMHSRYCVIRCPFCGKERPYPINNNAPKPLENVFVMSELWLCLGEHAFYCVGSNLDGEAIEKAIKNCKIIDTRIPEEEIRREPWRHWNLR
jgi:hypothetical protein